MGHCFRLVLFFLSFLSNRRLNVSIGLYTFSHCPLACGEFQGSILAPVRFPIYMLPVGAAFKKHGVSFNLYASFAT